MKMVKSLLLGSAAGVVAVTTGQAADLPVKAKPVEYVKVCSLYGAGFYYMPGTDLCIKVGGWIRAEVAYGSNGSPTWGPYAGMSNQRTTSNIAYRARGYITADVRNQTEYGTARGYLAIGLNTSDVGLNTAANQFSANRGFVQWGGLTAGLAQSFYDFYSVPASAYWGAYPASDTGDGGWFTIGYTLQLGNGFSVTLADETRRITQIINQNSIGTSTGGSITPGSYNAAATAGVSALGGGAALFPGAGAYGGQQIGDFVGNLRLDQAWGSAQVMGALHEVNASYYSTAVGFPAAPALANSGHPGDTWGWAAGVGLKLNMPVFGQGDWFQTQFNVTQGALRYIFNTPNTNWGETNGAASTFGVLSDAVYGGCVTSTTAGCAAGTNTSLQLTSAWGFNAGYEHYWSPQWHSSLYGGYDQVTYGQQANAMLCSGSAGTFGAGVGTAAVAAPGCNNNWSMYFIGSRTQWDVTKTFYLGVDVLYEQMKSGTLPGVGTLGAYSLGGSNTVEANGSDWMFRFRAHRDFLP